MSATQLFAEVTCKLRERLPDLRTHNVWTEGDTVMVSPSTTEPLDVRARWCREVVRVLPEYYCTRSRTRVRVTRAPEALGPPDFACGRKT